MRRPYQIYWQILRRCAPQEDTGESETYEESKRKGRALSVYGLKYSTSTFALLPAVSYTNV